MGIFDRVWKAKKAEEERVAATKRKARLEREKREAQKQEALRLDLTRPFLRLVEGASASLNELLTDPDFVTYFKAVTKKVGRDKEEAEANRFGKGGPPKVWRCLLLFSMDCGTCGIMGGFETDLDVDIRWKFWFNTEAATPGDRFILERNAAVDRDFRFSDWGLIFQPTKYGPSEAAPVGKKLEQVLGSMQTPESLLRYFFLNFGEPSHYGL